MGILDILKRKVETIFAESRQDEELIYEHVINEMDSGFIKKGLYAKALAKAKSDEDQANYLYMEYRMQSIKDSLKGTSFSEYNQKMMQQAIALAEEKEAHLAKEEEARIAEEEARIAYEDYEPDKETIAKAVRNTKLPKY